VEAPSDGDEEPMPLCWRCQRRPASFWYHPGECWLCSPCRDIAHELRDRLTEDGAAPPAEYECIHGNGEEGPCGICDCDYGPGDVW
jgi:hypothetical protein